MSSPSKTRLILPRTLLYYTGFVFVYVLSLVDATPSKAALHMYHLSDTNYRVLIFCLALPSLVLWLLAFVTYGLMKIYADTVNHSEEGPIYQRFARGFRWLAWSMPVAALVGRLLSNIANGHSSFHAASIIIQNYINLAIPLVGFTIIGAGARLLGGLPHKHVKPSNARGLMLVFVVVGVVYCFLTFRYFDLTSLGSSHNPYFMPVWITIITLLIPYLCMWYIGMLASYEIVVYSKSVAGSLYRHALRQMVGGLVMVIVCMIVLQFLSVVQPGNGHVVLNVKLAFTELFRIIEAVGFGLLASGVLRLQRIEEI